MSVHVADNRLLLRHGNRSELRGAGLGLRRPNRSPSTRANAVLAANRFRRNARRRTRPAGDRRRRSAGRSWQGAGVAADGAGEPSCRRGGLRIGCRSAAREIVGEDPGDAERPPLRCRSGSSVADRTQHRGAIRAFQADAGHRWTGAARSGAGTWRCARPRPHAPLAPRHRGGSRPGGFMSYPSVLSLPSYVPSRPDPCAGRGSGSPPVPMPPSSGVGAGAGAEAARRRPAPKPDRCPPRPGPRRLVARIAGVRWRSNAGRPTPGLLPTVPRWARCWDRPSGRWAAIGRRAVSLTLPDGPRGGPWTGTAACWFSCRM